MLSFQIYVLWGVMPHSSVCRRAPVFLRNLLLLSSGWKTTSFCNALISICHNYVASVVTTVRILDCVHPVFILGMLFPSLGSWGVCHVCIVCLNNFTQMLAVGMIPPMQKFVYPNSRIICQVVYMVWLQCLGTWCSVACWIGRDSLCCF
jgi:hypothetical protein